MFVAYRLIYVIDLIGVMFSALAIGAFFWPDLFAKDSFRSFFQNFGVEMMGTWISVRLIDFLIRERERADVTRTRILRHCRYWIRSLHPMLGEVFYRDLKHLEREFRYTSDMKNGWSKYLSGGERAKFEDIISQINESISLSNEIMDRQINLYKLQDNLKHKMKISIYKYTDDKSKIHEFGQCMLEMDNDLKTLIGFATSYIHDFDKVNHDSEIAFKNVNECLAKFEVDDNAQKYEEEYYKILQNKRDLRNNYKHIEDQFYYLESDVREETIES